MRARSMCRPKTRIPTTLEKSKTRSKCQPQARCTHTHTHAHTHSCSNTLATVAVVSCDVYLSVRPCRCCDSSSAELSHLCLFSFLSYGVSFGTSSGAGLGTEAAPKVVRPWGPKVPNKVLGLTNRLVTKCHHPESHQSHHNKLRNLEPAQLCRQLLAEAEDKERIPRSERRPKTRPRDSGVLGSAYSPSEGKGPM